VTKTESQELRRVGGEGAEGVVETQFRIQEEMEDQKGRRENKKMAENKDQSAGNRDQRDKRGQGEEAKRE
jgi:hypothetical protein